MRNHLVYIVIGIIIGIFATIFYTTLIPGDQKVVNQNMKIPQSSDAIDAHFIEQMIPHHQDAVTMAKLAQSKAQKPEIRQLAENIIKSQEGEIVQMKNWYKEWFGRELPTGEEVMQQHGMMSNNSIMHMGMMGDDQDLEKLTDSADFDTEFIKQMIPHHQMAVMMASMLKGGSERPEMKKLADEIITAQTAEIDQMRRWLNAWQK